MSTPQLSDFGKRGLPKDKIKEELLKCGRNPTYFIDNYCRIQHKTRGLIPFKLYGFQKDVLRDFREKERVVICKSRQVGMSTLSAAYVCWMMVFQADRSILVMAHKQTGAAAIVKKVQLAYSCLPDWMKNLNTVKTDSKLEFQLSNRSSIKATATTTDAGRSDALSLLIIDEAAIIENMDETWTAISPTLSTGNDEKNKFNGVRCIALSSPKGQGNWFHKTFVEAQLEQNNFHPINLPWFVHPEYDQKWFENETRNLGPKEIKQEYECSFLGSGDTVIDEKDIEWLRSCVIEPVAKIGFQKKMWVYKEYNPDHTYFLSADVSRGDASDFSVFHIFDATEDEVAVEFQALIPTDTFSNVIMTAAAMYGKCMIVVEENSFGFNVLENLKREKYENIFYKKRAHAKLNEHVDYRYAVFDDDCTPGFSTNASSRPLLVGKLEEMIRNKRVKFYSSRFLAEIETFIWKDGKPQATKGYNDDLVMAAGIGLTILDSVFLSVRKSKSGTTNYANYPMIYSSKKFLNTKIRGQVDLPPVDTRPRNSYQYPMIVRG